MENEYYYTLDIDGCEKQNYTLESIVYISGEKIKIIDLSNCPSINGLYCRYNHLPELDLNECINLEQLSCVGNQLKCLDISNNPKLNYLVCDNIINIETIKHIKTVEIHL